ncbi:PD-(D/E)XK nuclease family protein [Candidatus Palauibacter sp.]|uniref:PDDEXK-like family protein n=1 Tax=Candidatus Palauibacter sp. TaxID=3101350 RepID=UPI003D1469F7
MELAPALEAGRTLERELDRHFARRFNVFEYLRTDELGLSRVIADLLDPANEHGQGATFLKAMLEVFPHTRERFVQFESVSGSPIAVRTEHPTSAGGRIDITVDIPDGDGFFCLAFENKPYAPQDAGQVTAYLRYLSEQYSRRFLLVYLPPSGEGPSDRDLPRADRELWESYFAIMPYAGENSLADWFAACRKRCKAERVKAFLRDAELHCRRDFGEATMTTDRPTQAAKEYLLKNPRHMPAALAVHDAWSDVRDEVCKQFLEQLCGVIDYRLHEELPDRDVRVQCRYGGDVPYSNILWVVSDAWIRYEDTDPLHPDGRTTIRLEAKADKGCGGPNGWEWGVCSPKSRSEMTASEQERRDRLHEALRERELRLTRSTVKWPRCDYVRRYVNWYSLVPDLYEECEVGGGRITSYFADRLLDIARIAVPAINEVEARPHSGT